MLSKSVVNVRLAEKKKHFFMNIEMDFFKLSYKEVPEGYCVIRIKDTNNYIHYKGGCFFLKDRMNNCFVTCTDIAEEVIIHIKGICIGDYQFEMVDFKKAYEEHGLIEKQILYN